MSVSSLGDSTTQYMLNISNLFRIQTGDCQRSSGQVGSAIESLLVTHYRDKLEVVDMIILHFVVGTWAEG